MSKKISNGTKEELRLLAYFTFCELIWFALHRAYIHFFALSIREHVSETGSIILGAMVIPYGVCMPIFYLLIKNLETKIPKGDYSCGGKSLLTLSVIQSGCVLPLFLINLVVMKIKGFSALSSNITLLKVFILLIFNPIVEEFMYRKLVLDRLRKLGDGKAILASSFLFSLVHLFSQGIATMVFAFLVALVWGYITIKTNRLIYAIVLHAFSNLYAYFLPQLLLGSKEGTALYFSMWIVLIPAVTIFLLVRDKNKIKELRS